MREALGPAIGELDLKELLLTPRGLRLVVRVCDVERSHYMVLRSMLPQVDRIPADWQHHWLGVAGRLADTVGDRARQGV